MHGIALQTEKIYYEALDLLREGGCAPFWSNTVIQCNMFPRNCYNEKDTYDENLINDVNLAFFTPLEKKASCFDASQEGKAKSFFQNLDNLCTDSRRTIGGNLPQARTTDRSFRTPRA